MRLWPLLLVACGGSSQTVTSDTLFDAATIASGSGAQLRMRAQLAESSGQPISHDGLWLELHVRAVDDTGLSTNGLFSVDLEFSSPASSETESIVPGNQSFETLLLEAGDCEPGCFAEVDLVFVHAEGSAASLALEARSEATVQDGDANVMISLESVF